MIITVYLFINTKIFLWILCASAWPLSFRLWVASMHAGKALTRLSIGDPICPTGPYGRIDGVKCECISTVEPTQAAIKSTSSSSLHIYSIQFKQHQLTAVDNFDLFPRNGITTVSFTFIQYWLRPTEWPSQLNGLASNSARQRGTLIRYYLFENYSNEVLVVVLLHSFRFSKRFSVATG